MTQLSLLSVVERHERPRKRVRAVSKAQYAVLLETPGLLSAKRHHVLTAMAAYREVTTRWPTTSELVTFMVQRRELPRASSNLISGRVTELVNGGVCEFLPRRICAVTGRTAHPVGIREAGSI